MIYEYMVMVPGTEGLRYFGPRIEPYATQGGPITKAEKIAAALDVNLPPQVAAVRDLKNMTIPAEEKNPERVQAKIKVFPIYDSSDAIMDTLGHMADADILEVPENAVKQAPGSTPQLVAAYYARLASVAQQVAAEQAQKELARVKASLPASAQALIPPQVTLTVDSGA